ncbi:leukotriene B4 receptor 1 [Clupea harengus]|uniref:Leukotriene B4 receptor 1 n=1 Tax=Clupea harengus TaxID=7950 RepID=A0A8M1KFW9_CLUHA|nr:leukotriene B4 receptor 1 [Clupea harengus]
MASAESPAEISGTGLVVACVILSLSFLVGAPGNLLVIWTILKHVKKRSHTVVLILHLAIADLLALITLPLWIYSLANSWIFGQVMCKATAYVVNACMYSSVFLLTIMSVECFVAVRYPFASVGWRRKQALHKLLFGVWVASFLLSIPVIPSQLLGDYADLKMCTFKQYNSDTEEIIFLLLETLVGFITPLTILVICYGCLYSRIAQMNFKSKRKSTGLIAAVVVGFVICWTPHHIGNILSLVNIGIQRSHQEVAKNVEEVRETMTFIAGALAFVSSTINPVLYVFAARSFRSSLRETGIQKLFRHISSTATGEGNKDLCFTSKKQTSHTQSSQCHTESKVQIDLHIDICDQTST